MDKLDEFARSSPFSKQTFITAQQQMLAFGIEAQKVVPYLDAIQNAVAAAGGSNNDIAEIATVFSKVQSSAKITAQDLQELGNRGVNAAELIGSQMGMTGAEVRESITAGTLDAQAALDALAAGMSDRFSGAADNVKNTFAGAMDRVKAAWRDFSSELAAPLVDPEGGGALVDMLNGVADAMRGFQDLPDPIKKLAGGLTLLGGAAALAAGSMILLAPKAIETVGAFKDLAAAHPRVAGGLKGVAKAAGVAAAAFTAAQLAAAAFGDSIDARSSAQWESTFRGTADAVGVTKASLDGIAGETYNLSDAWRRMKAPSALESFDDWSGDVLSMNTSLDTLNAEFANMGQALADIYQDDPAAAQKAFNDVLKQTGASSEELLNVMPAYRDALLEAENAQADVTESAIRFVSAQEMIAAALESDNAAISGQAEAYQTLIDGAGKAASSFVDLSDSIAGKKFSLSGWMDQLEKQAKAVEDWADNIQEIADRGVSQQFLQGLI
ncbi:tape measure protein, partial [Isoptericola hypogeus]|uniref:tape measure protein n=1 Tax=Isoptericola hypogeus TaxID=300179 RepID=UPI0031E03D14